MESARIGLWIAIVAFASVLFSLALACATPFAAIATVAGVNMRLRAALSLTAFAWLANQAIGYLVLGYPTTWDSFAWGAAIGIAAILGVVAVAAIRRGLPNQIVATIAGFLAAFCVYELALYAATAVLPSGDGAFSMAVVLEIFWTNALALIGLFALHRLAVTIGLIAPVSSETRAAGYA